LNRLLLPVINKSFRPELLILVPLVLSAYTHLWNITGFPSVHIDEAHYMRRVMLVINGMGPQESASTGYPRTYDHPYFGQLFLGGILKLIGYPNFYYSGITFHSIEILHLIPRLVMSVLAVLDTYLLYKITDTRYNRKIALIAAVLFAVMPTTWILRRIYLDTLLMPLLLSSILFASYAGAVGKTIPSNNINKKVLILLSGLFLGLAIYTKIPTFTFIPLVGLIIYFNSKSLRRLMMWLVPVFLIPLLWPLYAVSIGQGDLWAHWVVWQTERNKPLELSLISFFQMDPVITVGGIAGMIFACLRKDFFPLVWVAPFLVFSYFIGWVQYFHMIVLFPSFCIAFAILINSIRTKLINMNKNILSNIMIISIAIFGIIITTMIITLDVNSANFRIYTSIAEHLPNDDNVTLIGSHWWEWDTYWMTKFVMHKDYKIIDPFFDRNFKVPVKTDKVLFIDDPIFNQALSDKIRGPNIKEIRGLYNLSNTVYVIVDNMTKNVPANYPFNILRTMIENENHPQGTVKIRTNY
jgi:hypothetical protein